MSFSGTEMALGYARSRPPVHSRILELLWQKKTPFRHALDVGCGSGLSTAAMAGFAEKRTGVDPMEAMCRLAPTVAPAARFAVAAAEDLPFRAAAFDCITAAGSLNYADIDRVFPELARVLAPGGILTVYDFTPGRNFEAGQDLLQEWFEAFTARFPYPKGDAIELNPVVLSQRSAPAGFRQEVAKEFAIPVEMTPASYLEYILTETNVAGHQAEARAWCTQSLEPVWAGREVSSVLFHGYVASFSVAL